MNLCIRQPLEVMRVLEKDCLGKDVEMVVTGNGYVQVRKKHGTAYDAGIHCLCCHSTSYEIDDIDNLYCIRCHAFFMRPLAPFTDEDLYRLELESQSLHGGENNELRKLIVRLITRLEAAEKALSEIAGMHDRRTIALWRKAAGK